MKLDKYVQVDLDKRMQEGYKLMSQGKSVSASIVWLELWEMIKNVMKSYSMELIEDLERVYNGSERIDNWATDLEMELHNAILSDKSFAQKRIDFCTDYINRSKNKNDLNIIGMKRSIAATYFKMGMAEKGDKLFQELIKEDPKNGWNWIGWSDVYGIFAEEENRNEERALSILKEALEVENLTDRLDLLERLEGLYTDLEMNEELPAIRKMVDEEAKNNRNKQKNVYIPRLDKIKSVTSVKISRNDPCTCGSGKKYKKCCG